MNTNTLIWTVSPVLGLVAGAVAGTFAAPADPPTAANAVRQAPVPQEAPSPRVLLERPDCADTETARQLTEEYRRIQAAQTAMKAVDADIEALLGPSLDLDIPDDHEWSAANARATVRGDLIAIPDAELHDIRCEELPCRAVIHFPQENPEGTTARSRAGAIIETLGLDPDAPFHMVGTGTDEKVWSMTVPLVEMPERPSWNWVRRVDHLVDRTGENVLTELR